MFWNVENFFDYFDDEENSWDDDFTPMGARHWNSYKFYKKCRDVGKVILAVGDGYGLLPDVVGLAEVENSFVLRSIINTDILKKLGYGYVHYNSKDRRGIDVALLYRKSTVEILSSTSYNIGDMATRNILCVAFSKQGLVYNVLVNHHPSKYGGEKVSIIKRKQAIDRMVGIVDSLEQASCERIVAVGDYNEVADDEIYIDVEHHLKNMGKDEKFNNRGTIKYKGKWDLIDNFFVSHRLSSVSQMEIPNLSFLMEADRGYGGDKVRRTYLQTIYKGGISDHLPVVLFSSDSISIFSQ